MIPLNFGLWWSGAPLSYLRYLTFKTLRHFHPHSRIQLFTNPKCVKGNVTGQGGIREQECGDEKSIKIDYTNKLKDLGVEIVKTDRFSNVSPNYQSDMFRWFFLITNGGFYLDTDQIIIRSFNKLPLKHEFIYSSYKVNSVFVPDGWFSPVGVLGAVKNSKIVEQIMRRMPQYYNSKDYNSIGPWMFRDLEKKIDMSQGFNAPSHYFYPAAICDQMNKIFDGSLQFKKDTFAAHWYGGCGVSQIFNKKYTEEFAKTSNDSISNFLREKKLI